MISSGNINGSGTWILNPVATIQNMLFPGLLSVDNYKTAFVWAIPSFLGWIRRKIEKWLMNTSAITHWKQEQILMFYSFTWKLLVCYMFRLWSSQLPNLEGEKSCFVCLNMLIFFLYSLEYKRFDMTEFHNMQFL